VFPFNRPLPPEAGDNQALAVNTADGGTVYDVAFALVWADGDQVLNTNEAYALASCTGCQTVAVAFQVVLIVGEANVVVPQNLSAAVNYACVECVTYALATQLVLTLPEGLDGASTAEIEALWKEIAAFGATLEDVPLSELQARLSGFEARILAIVRDDPGAAPAAGAGQTPTATTATTGPASAPTGAATSTPGGTVQPPAPTPTATGGTPPAPSQTSASPTATAPRTAVPTAEATSTSSPSPSPETSAP
jgi:putative peptide zinc metalloprotease protein